MEVGVVGEIDPAVTDALELEERVAWIELDLSTLLAMPEVPVAARPLSRYPSTDVDFAFVVSEMVPAAAVATTIRSSGGELVQAVDLFDVFRSDSLGDGRRSLAFRVRFQAPERTLTDVEVAELRGSIVAEVERTHDAALRG
jgi:phenylalanyl-tRNA synthetase beta chain